MQGIIMGNCKSIAVVAVALTPAEIAANTSAEQDFTVTGAAVGDYVDVNKPTAQAGLSIVNIRVKSANTVSITFGNFTGSGITPTAAQTYRFLIVRPEDPNSIPSTVNL